MPLLASPWRSDGRRGQGGNRRESGRVCCYRLKMPSPPDWDGDRGLDMCDP
jgi:hypothetical protein